MKKSYSIVALFLSLAIILTACTSTAPPATSVSQPASGTQTPAAPPVQPAPGLDANVTEPITLELWHTLEEMYRGDFDKLVAGFTEQNPNIKVNVSYQGRVGEVLEKVLAANVAGQSNLPDVFPIHSSEIKRLAKDSVVENLTPYVQACGTKTDSISMSDVYALDGDPYGLPWTITGMVWFYNQTQADSDGIALPKAWADMDAFLRKATVKNADGTTARYALWVGGWDSYYFTWLLWNNGVLTIDENGNTGINSEKATEVVTQVKKWVDEGLMMWGYGTNGSTNMRQSFWDGKVFAVVHTSSQYMNHQTNMEKKGYALGACMPPAGPDADTTEVFGMCLSVPSKLDPNRKMAAYKLIEYLASAEVNLEMAEFTGFLANGVGVADTDAGKQYLKDNAAMQGVYDRIGDMSVAIQLPCYPGVTDVLEDGMALIFLENADIQKQLDTMAGQIKELYEDQ